MSVSNSNYTIISKLMDKAFRGEMDASFMSLEDAKCLWSLGERIAAPSLGFRIIRVFSSFKSYFPRCIKRYYLGHVKNVFHQYQVRYINQLKSDTSSKYIASLLNCQILTIDIYSKIKQVASLQKKIVKVVENLKSEGWSDQEIDHAVDNLYRKECIYLDQVENILKESCAQIRKTTENMKQNSEAWGKKLRLAQATLPLGKAANFQHSTRFQPVFSGIKIGTDEDINELEKRLTYLDILSEIENSYQEYMKKNTASALKQHKSFLLSYSEDLSAEHCSAFDHIKYIIDDINSGCYSKETISVVLKLLLKMTVFGIRQETIKHYIELNVLKKKPTSQEKQNRTHKGVITVIKGQDGQSLAKLRSGNSDFGSKKCELLAYELEHILGGDGVPPTIRLRSGNLLQKYIPDAHQLDAYLENEECGAEKIKQLGQAALQTYLTLALIRGRGDGHGANTIIQTGNGTSGRLYQIDEEDFLVPNSSVTKNFADEGKQAPRIPALGFPQGAKPYPLALIKLFTWDGFKNKSLKQSDLRGLSTNRKAALVERLEKIIEVCRFESQKDEPILTPRDLYFLIHGKDFLYEICKSSGLTDYEFFSYAIGNNDDRYPKRIKKEISFYKNVEMLNANWSEPKFSMNGADREQYPGDTLLRKVKRELKNCDSIKLIELDPKAFDDGDWVKYKKGCNKSNRTIKSYMLSYFLHGFPKRMARQLSFLYPTCPLDVTKGDDEKLYLQIAKPQSLIDLEMKVKGMREKTGSFKVVSLRKKDFDMKRWMKSSGNHYNYGRTLNIVQCVLGKDSEIVKWIWDSYLKDSLGNNQYLTFKETKESFDIFYHRF